MNPPIRFISFVMLALTTTSGAKAADSGNAIGDSLHKCLAIQNGNSAPQCDYCPAPEESKKDKKNGVKGTVTMKVVISAEGLPTRVDVAKSLSKERDEKAVATVKKWRFKPARTVDGDAVEATTYVNITFAP
jgi:TonB family protein